MNSPPIPERLLLGCGHRRHVIDLATGERDLRPSEMENTTVCDIEHTCEKPGERFICADLNEVPWPFGSDVYDEVHAYEVLEHLGSQGDAFAFFAHFSEIWRVLKPGGWLHASVPRWDRLWAWGDPSHTRIINEGSLSFLSQASYDECATGPRTDFRDIYSADFSIHTCVSNDVQMFFILEAIK